MLFNELGIKQDLTMALAAIGITNPTEIQLQAIPALLNDENIVCQSQTGTGKTFAFLLPLIQNKFNNPKSGKILILVPTRELAIQISQDLQKLLKYAKLHFATIYGGSSAFKQKQSLLSSPEVVIATPGRLIDFIETKVLDLGKFSSLVLDEVDIMFDMGFTPQIKKIIHRMKNLNHLMAFSATISPEIQKLISDKVKHYKFIKIGNKISVDQIKQYIVKMDELDKLVNLIKILNDNLDSKVVIYTHTKRNTQIIGEILQQYFEKVGFINGDMDNKDRINVLNSFKNDNLKVLVTTDVTGRGLNMENVDIVINFEVPNNLQSYIHRIGRTGRANQTGQAIMFVCPDEKPLLKAIEREYKINIKESNFQPVYDKNKLFYKIRLDNTYKKRIGK